LILDVLLKIGVKHNVEFDKIRLEFHSTFHKVKTTLNERQKYFRLNLNCILFYIGIPVSVLILATQL